ncbi:hypothetical protein CFP56_001640 [Quercus suber]|uniref:Uncharacterized protein n=1 Tax=Quercus suber TaxID=58331 RepID=A0AAW0LGJ5_QUESU
MSSPIFFVNSDACSFSVTIAPGSIAAGMSTRGNTAAIMIEASTAFGVYLNNGVMSSNVRRTTQDITMLATAVLQPAMKFTAERENDPACTRQRWLIKC